MKAIKCQNCKGKGYVIRKSDCVRYRHLYTDIITGKRLSFCYYCGKKKSEMMGVKKDKACLQCGKLTYGVRCRECFKKKKKLYLKFYDR